MTAAKLLFIVNSVVTPDAASQLKLAFDSAPEVITRPTTTEQLDTEVDAVANHDLEPTAIEKFRAARALEKELSKALGKTVSCTFTRNRKTMLSSRERGDTLEVRLHHIFMSADTALRRALANYIAGKRVRSATRSIDAFIGARQEQISRPVQRPRLAGVGDHHDLIAIMTDLQKEYFKGVDFSSIAIVWGKRTALKRQYSINLGSYHAGDRVIRIHPKLDVDWVPRFFVEAVVYHEMLHHTLGAVEIGGRRHHHTAEFRQREEDFSEHARSEKWLKENLSRLLRA